MPFYNDLRPESDYETRDYAQVFPGMRKTEKIRTIDNLLRLKAGLYEKIPDRKSDSNILVASWNIKEFGHTTQRLSESYFYIAEVISRFDLVSIQEVKSTLVDLEIVMRILGSDWDYIINDITDGTTGNSERSAYLFNNKRVKLSGLAAEIVLWPKITAGSEITQLKRTPYITGFKAGWKSFALINLHLHPGDNDEDVEYRREEIRLLLAALEAKRSQFLRQNLVLSGDFNLYTGPDDPAIAAINESGYTEVDGLIGKDTNLSQTEAYDRFFIAENNYFKVTRDSHGNGIGDVFNPYEYVFLQSEHTTYKEDMIAVYGGSADLQNDATALDNYFMRYWRRNQISDHLPIWFDLTTDSSVDFLTSKKEDLQD